jgi:predicted DNA-binding transcriptional regulator AlpA
MTEPKRKLVPTREVCERYGVCDRTIDRWIEDPKLGFPQPRYIRQRRYWDEGHLDAFDGAGAVA